MFLHYIGKVNSSILLQITTEKIKKCVVFDKNKTFMLLYGWLEVGVLFSTAYARIVCRSPARRTHAQRRAARQLHVIDALVGVMPHLLHTLFQFISVVHPRRLHSLLD